MRLGPDTASVLYRRMSHVITVNEDVMAALVCDVCKTPMKRVSTAPMKPGFDVHNYRCEKCSRTDRLIQDTRFSLPEE